MNMTFGEESIVPYPTKGYETAQVQGGTWEDMKTQQGKAIYSHKNPSFAINRLGLFKHLGNQEFMCCQYYGHPIRIKDTGNGGFVLLERYTNIPYQNPTSSNTGFAYDSGMDYDQTSQLLVRVSWARHVVRVYDMANGGVLWGEVGEDSDANGSFEAGHVSANKLYNPRSALIIGTKLFISSYNGYGENGTNHGHITEYDLTNVIGGKIQKVATRMEFTGDGQSGVGNNKVYRPMDIQLDPNDNTLVWVNDYGRNRLLLVKIQPDGGWLTERVIHSPAIPAEYQELNTYTLFSGSWSFGVGDNYLYVYSNSYNLLTILNKSDGTVYDIIDNFHRDKSKPTFSHGGHASYGRIVEYTDTTGKLAILLFDWNHNCVHKLYVEKEVDIPVEAINLPNNWQVGEVITPANSEYDQANNKITINRLELEKINNTDKVTVLTEKI